MAAYESLYPKFNKYLPQRYHMIENVCVIRFPRKLKLIEEQVDMKKAVEFIAQVKVRFLMLNSLPLLELSLS